jgi:hypothetical protein
MATRWLSRGERPGGRVIVTGKLHGHIGLNLRCST